MSKYFLFTSVVGSFAFDENFKPVERGEEKDLLKKYNAIPLPKENIKDIMPSFRKSDYYTLFRQANLELTKDAVRKSVAEDLLIIQTINSIEELDKVANTMVKRLREWYELYFPEVSREIESHDEFVSTVLTQSKSELLKQLKITEKESMGGSIHDEDVVAIKELAAKVAEIHTLRKSEEKYLENLTKRCFPNVVAITGSLIAAKLMSHAGNLGRLSEMPSSTIQLLGAEKALFRHVKTGARSPKHGLIVQHSLFSKAKAKQYGKIARLLADKISIAAKVDFFKGKFIGDKLREEIEGKVTLMIS